MWCNPYSPVFYFAIGALEESLPLYLCILRYYYRIIFEYNQIVKGKKLPLGNLPNTRLTCIAAKAMSALQRVLDSLLTNK